MTNFKYALEKYFDPKYLSNFLQKITLDFATVNVDQSNLARLKQVLSFLKPKLIQVSLL